MKNSITYHRVPAKRVFAAELSEVTKTFKLSETDEKAPTYALLPTGERAARVIAMGVFSKRSETKDGMTTRVNITDPTGAFYVSASGQFASEAKRVLCKIDPKTRTFVAVEGSPNVYVWEGEDTKKITVSLNAKKVFIVDEETYLQWVQDTAVHTIARIKRLIDPMADDIDVVGAREIYTTRAAAYWLDVVRDAL